MPKVKITWEPTIADEVWDEEATGVAITMAIVRLANQLGVEGENYSPVHMEKIG